MKKLVVFAHPNYKESIVNKRWIDELEKYQDEFTIHKLYTVYPDEKLDVKREQALVESHDSIIFQFPIYWFNCPPLMKKWFDEVLLHSWAYGSGGDKFMARKVALAVTVGGSENDYSIYGARHHSLGEVLLPFEITFSYIDAIYEGFTAFYGAEFELTDARIEDSVPKYIDFMRGV